MNKLYLKIQTLIILFLLIQGTVNAQKDTLSFLHITDLHTIFSQDNYHPEIVKHRNQKQYDQGIPHLRQFLKTVPTKTHSKLVVATGDLIDFFEAKTIDDKMLSTQVRQFSKLVANSRTPIFFTMGNHDGFTFDWQENKLKHTQNFVGKARALWIQNLDCFKNGIYYSKIMQVGTTTYRLIFLDDSFYKFLPEDKIEVPYVDKPQLYWLRDQLNESKTDVEIILMHIPFPGNLLQSGVTNDLYEMLSKSSSVKLILGGHNHRNAINRFPAKDNNEIVQAQTGALVNDIDNWRQIRLTENDIQISFPGKAEAEITIPAK